MDYQQLRAAVLAFQAVTGYRFQLPEKQADEKHPDLLKLLRAKRESDKKNYPRKHQILREMLMRKPSDFSIDSENSHVVGLMHVSGFKIHMPRTAVPTMPKPLKRLEKAP